MNIKDREGPTNGEFSRSFGNRILRSGTGPVLAPRPEPRPTPGGFYQIKPGDNLLEVAGQAYGVKAGAQRLEFAKLINNANYNCRFWREAPEGEKKWFPRGGSLSARVSTAICVIKSRRKKRRHPGIVSR